MATIALVLACQSELSGAEIALIVGSVLGGSALFVAVLFFCLQRLGR